MELVLLSDQCESASIRTIERDRDIVVAQGDVMGCPFIWRTNGQQWRLICGGIMLKGEIIDTDADTDDDEDMIPMILECLDHLFAEKH